MYKLTNDESIEAIKKLAQTPKMLDKYLWQYEAISFSYENKHIKQRSKKNERKI